MMDWIREILERYGQTVTVQMTDGQVPTRAFLQPVTGLGWSAGRWWLYLGQPPVGPADRVLWNGMTFRVRSSRPYYIGKTLTYWWASLETEREAAE